MARKIISTDAFMQFKSLTALTDAADTTTLVESVVPTGISIRSELCFLVHMIEWHFRPLAADLNLILALSTRSGLIAAPALIDPGCISRIAYESVLVATEGCPQLISPYTQRWVPPIPIAAPSLSLYVATAADVATYRGKTVQARIGFTTFPLDARMYTEIAEVWGW